MKELVPKLYKSYGMYTNRDKMLPNIVDGLLPVQKRMLLGGHVICRDSFTKTATVLGNVMAKWHPHSEATGTAEWAVLNKFMDGGGWWGSRIGSSISHCAAPRYTKLRANKSIEKIAFKYVKHVEWKELELEPEPVTIPTLIPFCLMSEYETNTIAFGFKADIPCYQFQDLVKRVLWLMGGKKGREPVIKPKMGGCKITSNKGVLKDLLTTGKANLEIKGTYTEEKSKNIISINSWSPRITFQTLLNRMDKFKGLNLLSSGSVGYRDASNKRNGTKCVFEIQKQRNRNKIYEQMKEAIIHILVAKVRYKIYAVDWNGEVREPGVDDMLILAYNFHRKALLSFFEDSVDSIIFQINELNMISKIRPHISNVTNDISDVNIVCDKLSLLTQLSVKDIKTIISKHTIRKLMTVDTDISTLVDKKDELLIKIKNVDEENLKEYQSFL